jgi:hypothetical protein
MIRAEAGWKIKGVTVLQLPDLVVQAMGPRRGGHADPVGKGGRAWLTRWH